MTDVDASPGACPGDAPRVAYVVTWTTEDSDDLQSRSWPTLAEARAAADDLHEWGYDVDVAMLVSD